jgi:transcriptional regulator with XRE-family HTH domain
MAKFISFPVIDMPATGRSIELHRRAAHLSVKDIQTYFGFEYPQAVYKWQRGETLPSVDNLLALARLLKVSMEDLLVYEDQEVPLVFGEKSYIYTVQIRSAQLFI